MADSGKDFFGTQSLFETGSGNALLYSLEKLEKENIAAVSALPFSIKILLECALRSCDGRQVTEQDVLALAGWKADETAIKEIPFKPARVLLQDFTGVPALVDLAAMRSAVQRLGDDPRKIEPLIPCDLVIDHSIQVDVSGHPDALQHNMRLEFQRNRERYEFLKWGQNAFKKFRIIPPGLGIIHQVNLEFLSTGVLTADENGKRIVYPDSLVGTDSHTTMINGLGIVGWGVGGIEAEAVMLGQPIYMALPQVVGFKLYGRLPEGATATDLALTVTQLLRKKGVVGKFVEFYGPGITMMSLPDRATVANMAPEYGATLALFPVDSESIDYLKRTGRPAALVRMAERYYKQQGLFCKENSPVPTFTEQIELDLGTVEPSVAGPKRPHDRIKLSEVKKSFQHSLTLPLNQGGFQIKPENMGHTASISIRDRTFNLSHGAVVIASITSCTNTSNPSVMLAAGLLAKKALEKGLTVPPFVKTSLSPGSRVVTEYLVQCGLQDYLDRLGFQTVGYGCMTCIGNSGPVSESVASVVNSENLTVAAVISGNRNFEGRVHPVVKANYLASPPLVLAFALAGTVQIDFVKQPLGNDTSGTPVFLRDIWPSQQEVLDLLVKTNQPESYYHVYSDISQFNSVWNDIRFKQGALYDWQETSTYIQQPPYFDHFAVQPEPVKPFSQARVLLMLGDSVTTDHISPAGTIHLHSPAAHYLMSRGIPQQDYNTYGSRRGNDKVMVRGTFANIRLKNLLLPDQEGFMTLHFPEQKMMSIYDAAMLYRAQEIPTIIIAGKEYGCGSSRDWAAKGPALLGIRAVIAQSYERIHRSNLIGMGILPLQFKPGDSAASIGLTGHEKYSIELDENVQTGQEITIVTEKADGTMKHFSVILRLDTLVEIGYYQNGGILPAVLRHIMAHKYSDQ